MSTLQPAKVSTVLIVAESPADIGLLPYALERHGMRVRVVTMADTALAALSEGDIDLALIDVGMRQRSGFDMCALVKESERTRHIPVMLMSSRPSPDERRRASECGASDYLVKPLDPDAVIGKIDAQLAPGEASTPLLDRRSSDDVKAAHLHTGQAKVLEMVARGAPLGDTLDQLMLLIESQSEGVYCSVLLLDEDGLAVHPASGPSLPPDYMAALEGLHIGPSAGSCGTSMYRKELVIVSDIMNDPLWAPYTGLIAPYGLRACWSTPIYLDKNHVLGSFAMYYRDVRSPKPEDMHLIEVASHLAGIAIERTRRERELIQHREHLEVLVAARTAQLTLAQEELVRRDKLAALGRLVAGVAHELNTPIGNSLVIATTMAERARALSADLATGLRRSSLESYLAQADEANDILARNLQRAGELVASFKQIAVDQTNSQRQPFSLAQLISELLPPLRIAAKNRRVSVELALEPGLPMESYPGPLTQVISNLFDNSLLHGFDGREGGTIRIGATARPTGQIALMVADNGAGIPAALVPRVYDPFFTTRLGRGGSGLGLHVAHNIVTGILGGRIELESELGKGTTFTLLLPAVAPELEPAG